MKDKPTPLIEQKELSKLPVPTQIRDLAIIASSQHVDGLEKARAVQQLKDIKNYIEKVLEVNNIKGMKY